MSSYMIHSGYFTVERLGCGDSCYDPSFLLKEEVAMYWKVLCDREDDGSSLAVQKIAERLQSHTNHEFDHYCVHILHYREEHNVETTNLVYGTSSTAIVSLGGVRTLQLRSKDGSSCINLPLRSGSILLLGPETNAAYDHVILKAVEKVEPRISLTFGSIY